jgi:peptide/nickel transport system ATP-binding protein
MTFSPATPVLHVQDLHVQFHTAHGIVEAVDGVTLRVEQGEIMGLVGESGCGKTATARAVLGVIPTPPGRVTQGTILFRGNDLLQMSEPELNQRVRGRAITLIPQDTLGSFNPLFPVGTQMRDILRWKTAAGAGPEATDTPPYAGFLARYIGIRTRAARHRIVDLLQQVQLPDAASQWRKYPHEFSGGQRQRLLIAMALLPDPALIIADEPTTALDVTVQAQILRLLKRLVKRRGISVLFITHDMGVVATLCDRVTVMYAGQEMEVAPTAALFAQPAHPYTQMLLASLPDHRRSDLEGIPGVVPSLINPPRGCRFNTRCPWVQSRCFEARPPVRQIAPGHTVRCHLF